MFMPPISLQVELILSIVPSYLPFLWTQSILCVIDPKTIIMLLQVLFGPRRCEGIGLERLWSYMRRYSRMTKEMRPSHRIDVLCSALTHYGMHKKNKLGVF